MLNLSKSKKNTFFSLRLALFTEGVLQLSKNTPTHEPCSLDSSNQLLRDQFMFLNYASSCINLGTNYFVFNLTS